MNHAQTIDAIALPHVGDAGQSPHRGGGASIKAGPVVVAGLLAELDASLGSQDRSDVAISTLFAQLAADHASDKFSEVPDWTAKLREVLAAVGWTEQAATNGSPERLAAPIDWPRETLDAFDAGVGMPSGKLGPAIEAARKQAPGGKAATVWNRYTSDGASGLYLTAVAERRAGGDAILSLMISSFDPVTEDQGILSWGEDAEILNNHVRMELNSDVYARVRDQIIAKLKGREATEIVSI